MIERREMALMSMVRSMNRSSRTLPAAKNWEDFEA
jgi:hypothetical protein